MTYDGTSWHVIRASESSKKRQSYTLKLKLDTFSFWSCLYRIDAAPVMSKSAVEGDIASFVHIWRACLSSLFTGGGCAVMPLQLVRRQQHTVQCLGTCRQSLLWNELVFSEE